MPLSLSHPLFRQLPLIVASAAFVRRVLNEGVFFVLRIYYRVEDILRWFKFFSFNREGRTFALVVRKRITCRLLLKMASSLYTLAVDDMALNHQWRIADSQERTEPISMSTCQSTRVFAPHQPRQTAHGDVDDMTRVLYLLWSHACLYFHFIYKVGGSWRVVCTWQ